MSEFSKNSAWAERDNLAAYHDAQRMRNRSVVPKQSHEAAPKTAAIPHDVLEDWMGDLDDMVSNPLGAGDDEATIRRIVGQMGSYFPG